MSSKTSFTVIPLPVFYVMNLQVCAVRMEAYLNGNDLWEDVEDKYEVPPLPNSPNMAQINLHKCRMQRKPKARASLLGAVSSNFFNE